MIITKADVDRITGAAEWPQTRYARALFGLAVFETLNNGGDLWIRALLAGTIADRRLKQWYDDWASLPDNHKNAKTLQKLARKELAQ